MKKHHLTASALAASLLILPSCKKETVNEAQQEMKKAGQEAAAVIETQAKELQEGTAQAVTSAQQAVKDAVAEFPAGNGAVGLPEEFGIVNQLPMETDGFFSILNLAEGFDGLLKTQLGEWVLSKAREEGESIDEVLASPEVEQLRAALGQELFVAFGDGAGEQLGVCLELSRLINYGSGRNLITMAEQSLKPSEDFLERMQKTQEAQFAGFLQDVEKSIELFEFMELPPILVGSRIPKEDVRNFVAAAILGQFAQAPKEGAEFIEEYEIEKSGTTFQGFVIKGARIEEQIRMDLEGKDAASRLKIFKTEENFERALKAVGKKNIYVVSGVRGEHVLVYAGASVDGLHFVDDSGESLGAHPEIKFANNYAGKDLRLFSFGPAEAWSSLKGKREIIASILKGLSDGLAASESFGDTRDIQRLLKHAIGLEGSIYAEQKLGHHGWVGFVEDGFKIESHSGSDSFGAALAERSAFASAADMDELLLFSCGVAQKEFRQKMGEWVETLAEVASLSVDRVAEMDLQGADLQGFKQGYGLYKMMLEQDILEIVGALYSDLGGGLGADGAFMVDLKGEMPTIPGLPAPLVEGAPVPRVAYASTVEDRQKVARSWTRVDAATRRLLKKAEQLNVPPIPMQQPFSSEKDGLTSYYFTSIPFMTPNMMPSVSISDDYFYFNTSPKFAEEITAASRADSGGKKGQYFRLNLDRLHGFAEQWLDLVEENKAAVFKDDEDRLTKFERELPEMRDLLKATKGLLGLEVHSRAEEGENRTSIHFKVN